MPSFYIENDTVAPGDDELRTLHKYSSSIGVSGVSTMYPEGLAVRPSDDEQRTLHKIKLANGG